MTDSLNYNIATAKVYIDRAPLALLKRLEASIGWVGGVGYIIPVSDSTRLAMAECIAFHEGKELSPEFYAAFKKKDMQ